MSGDWNARSEAWRLGVGATATLGLVLLAWALTIDYPRASYGFFSDASTYYGLGHSLADDGDFEFRREDLVRVWREFPSGPEGIFLKRGSDPDLRVDGTAPFVHLDVGPDRLVQLVEGRDVRGEIRPGQPADGGAAQAPSHQTVVVQHRGAVRSHPHVALHAGGAQPQREGERLDGVLGSMSAGPTVCE